MINTNPKPRYPFGRLDRHQSRDMSGLVEPEFYSSHSTQVDNKASAFRFSPPYYQIRQIVLAKLFEELGDFESEKVDRTYLFSRVAEQISAVLRQSGTHVNRTDADGLTRDLVDDLIGFGPLEDLLADKEITDIMVVGPKLVFFERHGRISGSQLEFQDDAHLIAICQRIARRIGRRIDESSPMCDARLPDGSRVNIIVPPLAIDGPSLTIRKFQKQRLNFRGLLALGALNESSIEFLKLLVEIRCNIIVIGGTGSGKTTFLNSLNQFLASEERIVTCEDAAELQLQKLHIVRLETRSQNLEGSGEVNMRALIRNSLRMRPDRIIVGEVRGEEAFDFTQAMNTGHDGSMGTMHANSCLDALSRLEGLISLGAPSLPVRTIQQMMTSAIDIIIEVRRFRDGTRRLSEIQEIVGLDESGIRTRTLLEFHPSPENESAQISGSYVFDMPMSHRIRRKAEHAGLVAGFHHFQINHC